MARKRKINDFNYRKLYEQHYGAIPKDDNGRTFEIHHKDGNRANNDINNLQCVSIEEHYQIHRDQGDWAACLLITRAMEISPEEKSRLNVLHNRKMVEDGIHPFKNIEKQRERQLAKVAAGQHHWQRPEHSSRVTKWNLERSKNGTHPWKDGDQQRERQLKRVEKGEHHWQDKEAASKRAKKRLEEGNHTFQQEGYYEKIAEKRAKEYTFMFPDGCVRSIKNLTRFCKDNNLSARLMRRVANGQQESHKHFKKGILNGDC